VVLQRPLPLPLILDISFNNLLRNLPNATCKVSI
jgi:hypothetical protein